MLSLKIGFKAQALETGEQTFDGVVHELGTLTIYFSKLAMAEVYVVQQVAGTKIRI